MIRTLIILWLAVNAYSLSFAQSKSEVFNTNQIVWYGLDFSEARLIGSEGFTDPVDIKNRLFDSWNNLFISEPDKYDLKKTFGKANVENDLSLTEERNKAINVKNLVTDNSFTLAENTIPLILKQYHYDQKEGVGLVFIIESFNKTKEQGTMYVTFFDIATKKPLLIKKMSGEPGGFGIRNYWAASYYDVLKQCKKEYPKWKKE